MNILCKILDHKYRNRVPRIYECEVYCLRCGRVFGHFDSPQDRDRVIGEKP